MMTKKIAFLAFFLSAMFILAALSFSYFQQDEWHTFGVLQAYGGADYLKGGFNFFNLIFAGRVGSRLITMIIFNLFGPNGTAFGITSGFLHILNSILIFMVVLEFTKNKKMSYIASLFFLINSVADQSFMWFGTMAGTLPSMTFALLSFIFYIKFLSKRKYIALIISLFFLFSSFLFKEGAYAMFIVYPIMWFLYTDKKSFTLFLKENFFILIYGLFTSLLYLKDILFMSGDRINYVAPQNGGGLVNLVSHLIFYPFEGLSQIFIPSDFIFNLSRKITEVLFPAVMPGTIDFDIFYTVKMANYISIAASILLVVLLGIVYERFKRRISSFNSKALLISICITALSFVPVAVLDVSNAYLDSRYYYPSLLGAAIFFGITSVVVMDNVKKAYKRIVIGIIILILGCHAMILGTDLVNQVKVSQERVSIMNSIIKVVPKPQDKTIIYVSGDSEGYYGLPELKVPFQSGLGEMLMVKYDDPQISRFFKEDTSLKTFNGGFLWGTLSQGYKQEGDRGFGYFTDTVELKKTIKKYRIDVSKSLFAFYYKSDSKKLINITTSLRRKVEENINE